METSWSLRKALASEALLDVRVSLGVVLEILEDRVGIAHAVGRFLAVPANLLGRELALHRRPREMVDDVMEQEPVHVIQALPNGHVVEVALHYVDCCLLFVGCCGQECVSSPHPIK